MKILSYWGIPLPPEHHNSILLTEHFTQRAEHLAAFLELPGKHLGLYCAEEKISYGIYLWLCDQIGGGNYAVDPDNGYMTDAFFQDTPSLLGKLNLKRDR